MSKKTAPKGGRFTRALACSLGAAQPLGRKLIDGVELPTPNHAAWIRGKCNRRSHKRPAPSRNCAVGTLAIWQAGRGRRQMNRWRDRNVTEWPTR
jgi:hypothetical protein